MKTHINAIHVTFSHISIYIQVKSACGSLLTFVLRLLIHGGAEAAHQLQIFRHAEYVAVTPEHTF